MIFASKSLTPGICDSKIPMTIYSTLLNTFLDGFEFLPWNLNLQKQIQKNTHFLAIFLHKMPQNSCPSLNQRLSYVEMIKHGGWLVKKNNIKWKVFDISLPAYNGVPHRKVGNILVHISLVRFLRRRPRILMRGFRPVRTHTMVRVKQGYQHLL